MNRGVLMALVASSILTPWCAAIGADVNSLPVLERTLQQVTSKQVNGVLISIPRTALTSRDTIPGVYVVENNEARFRMVRPGKHRDGQVEILSGLFGNEILVIDDLDAVHDGSPIKAVSTVSPGNSSSKSSSASASRLPGNK